MVLGIADIDTITKGERAQRKTVKAALFILCHFRYLEIGWDHIIQQSWDNIDWQLGNTFGR